MAERRPRPSALAEQPDEVIRVVRALKEMGAHFVRIGDVEVRFDAFEAALPNRDTKEESEERAKDRAAKEREWDLFGSA